MPNYYTVTRNPIARAGIIRKLMSMGYKLAQSETVSTYFNRWPADRLPVVLVRTDGEFAERPTIDLTFSTTCLPPHPEGNIRVSPVTLKGVPNITPEVKPSAVIPAPVFPKAAKYNISYQKADGSVGNYTISNPIEMQEDRFTSYAFGKGIKTFIKARVHEFSQVT